MNAAWGLDPKSVITQDVLLSLRERHVGSRAVFLHRLRFTISFELMKTFVTKIESHAVRRWPPAALDHI